MELPNISACTYSSAPLSIGSINQLTDAAGSGFVWPTNDFDVRRAEEQAKNKEFARQLDALAKVRVEKPTPIMKGNIAMPNLRIVRVFIVDRDDKLPLESRVLYSGEEKLTDLTDQELFFEVNINEALKAHNELRSKTLNKAATEKLGKDVMLEPIRIRDLSMCVVTVASF